jgi:putative transposase
MCPSAASNTISDRSFSLTGVHWPRDQAHRTTVVTEGRQPILSEEGLALLRRVVRQCLDEYPFVIDSMMVLPDHLHSIWTLPDGDAEYPKRWGYIKKQFTSSWLAAGNPEQPVSKGRQRERRRGVWVPRFWEHTIRDEQDFRRHLDYIHYNPVKHGYVSCPHAWGPSSFHRSLRRGLYEPHWGCTCRSSGDAQSREMDFANMEVNVGEDDRAWPRRQV